MGIFGRDFKSNGSFKIGHSEFICINLVKGNGIIVAAVVRKIYLIDGEYSISGNIRIAAFCVTRNDSIAIIVHNRVIDAVFVGCNCFTADADIKGDGLINGKQLCL